MDATKHTPGAGRTASLWKRYMSLRRGENNPAAALTLDGVALLLGFLFAGTHAVFGAYPFALGLLLALPGRVVPCYIGMLISAALTGPVGWIYAGLGLLGILLRLGFSYPGQRRFLPDSEGVFREVPQMRVVVSAIVGLAAAVYQLLAGDLTTVSLLFGGAMLFGVPLSCALYCGFLCYGVRWRDLFGASPEEVAIDGSRKGISALYMQLGALALLCTCALALYRYDFFGLSLGYLFCAAVVLYLSRRFGALRATIAGVLLPLALEPLYAPAFGILGLFSGVLWGIGTFYALGIGVVAGGVWASYAGGLSGFLALVPETTVSAMLLAPFLPRLRGQAEQEAAQKDKDRSDEAVRRMVNTRSDAQQRRMMELSDAFSSLSRVFRSMTDTTGKPALADYITLCDSTCSKYCRACARREECWENGDRSALEAIRILSGKLYAEETLDTESLPADLISGCAYLGGILEEIRTAGASLQRSFHRSGSAVGPDYDLLAKLLADAARTERAEAREDVRLGVELRRALREHRISTGTLAVYGQRMKWIVAGGTDWEGKRAIPAAVREEFEQICGCRLTAPEFADMDGVVTMQMSATPRYELERATASRAAGGEGVSGDSIAFFENREGFAYALLSDGLGSGERAALTSRICTVFLEKLLGTGATKTTALKMLNNTIRSQGDECSATVDLLEFDRLYGRATFIKSGAASSYVKRGSNLFRIRSKTMPVGLMKALDAEKIRFDIRPDDVLILLSDGVCPGGEEPAWLTDLLSSPWEAPLPDMAQKILSAAARANTRGDDMTVVLLRVSEPEAIPNPEPDPAEESDWEEAAAG